MKKGFNYWTLKEDIKGYKQWLSVLSLDHGALIAIVKVHAFKLQNTFAMLINSVTLWNLTFTSMSMKKFMLNPLRY